MVTYYLHKMIPAKTWCKTHNDKLLDIIKVFKIWRHYLKVCKYKVFVFTNYNNLRQFVNIKSLSFCQVHWAKKISCYYFQIDYCQGKANRAVNGLYCFSQRSFNGEEILGAKNTQILYCLQSSLTNASILCFSILSLLF